MKREVTTFEILKEIEENQKSDYNTIYDCLALCGIIEFAKHDEQKNDFIDCVSAFSEIIDTGNRINTTGATF
jgi:ABC-type sulfate transport system substrate-binding protein